MSSFKEIRQTLQEVSENLKKLEKSQEKTDEQLALTDAQLKKAEALMAESKAEFKEYKKEARREAREMRKELGGIGNSLGNTTEEFFYFALKGRPILGTMKFKNIFHAVKTIDPRLSEWDIILTNGESVAVIEVKHTLKLSDIFAFQEKLKTFFDCFPSLKNHQLYAGFASFHIPADIKEKIHSLDFFIIKRKGRIYIADTELIRIA